MELDFTNFLYALSYALDAAEREVTGTTVEHGKRVAYLCTLIAKGLSLSDEELVDLVGCAILHDNAIAEFLREEYDYVIEKRDDRYEEIKAKYGETSVHAYIGEENIRKLPFNTDITDVIHLHHENADGSGPFGKAASETPLFAQIIHLADLLDSGNNLPEISSIDFERIQKIVRENTGTVFSMEVSDLFLNHVKWEDIRAMQEKGPLTLLQENVPVIIKDYSVPEIQGIASFFADIVDFKSSFTKDHSIGVAKKAEIMARHYGFPFEKVVRFAFAGAVHDIGKMVVGNDILEKPDKLDAGEFNQMKNHAAETYKILSSVQGLEDITEWAANHHEKLDGTGYSRRLSAEEQTFEDRLMSCIDIYQALTETRPYKDGLSHRRSISIMQGMADDGKIDGGIVSDMDLVFGADQPDTEDDTADVRLTTKKWKCSVCGYVYEGDTAPANCPICDSDAEQFELVD